MMHGIGVRPAVSRLLPDMQTHQVHGRPTSGRESAHVYTGEYAAFLDSQDPLNYTRKEFLIPSKAHLKSTTLVTQEHGMSDDPCIYLCGNSLGLQPRGTSERIHQYLSTWAMQGVFGHFKPLSDSPLPPWLHVDDEAAIKMAPIVGAQPSEVAVMQTLTANLHFLMAAFYRPNPQGRHKILLESKAFPSDHYAVESQIRHHNLSPSTSMITIEPPSPNILVLTTSHILSVIDEHASTTALLLLPGIQFYTGQLLDIPTITAHARSYGIFVIWDLAHAVGNVELKLHEWECDAAAWCTYKYLNAGPGAIGGLFVHERNGKLSSERGGGEGEAGSFTNRLSGWWGSNKESRFAMTNHFLPIPGAAGFQLSNPSVLDITSLCASLEVFAMTDMASLRAKSIRLTGHLEFLLQNLMDRVGNFEILTPEDPKQRGAQLSLKLKRGLLDIVMGELEQRAVLVDERRPDVIRVAPAPLYNTHADIHGFVTIFGDALKVALKVKAEGKARHSVTDEMLLQTT